MNLSYDILVAQALESQIQNTSLFYKSSIVHPILANDYHPLIDSKIEYFIFIK